MAQWNAEKITPFTWLPDLSIGSWPPKKIEFLEICIFHEAAMICINLNHMRNFVALCEVQDDCRLKELQRSAKRWLKKRKCEPWATWRSAAGEEVSGEAQDPAKALWARGRCAFLWMLSAAGGGFTGMKIRALLLSVLPCWSYTCPCLLCLPGKKNTTIYCRYTQRCIYTWNLDDGMC